MINNDTPLPRMRVIRCPHCDEYQRDFLQLDSHLKWRCPITGNLASANAIAAILAPAV